MGSISLGSIELGGIFGLTRRVLQTLDFMPCHTFVAGPGLQDFITAPDTLYSLYLAHHLSCLCYLLASEGITDFHLKTWDCMVLKSPF